MKLAVVEMCGSIVTPKIKKIKFLKKDAGPYDIVDVAAELAITARKPWRSVTDLIENQQKICFERDTVDQLICDFDSKGYKVREIYLECYDLKQALVLISKKRPEKKNKNKALSIPSGDPRDYYSPSKYELKKKEEKVQEQLKKIQDKRVLELELLSMVPIEFNSLGIKIRHILDHLSDAQMPRNYLEFAKMLADRLDDNEAKIFLKEPSCEKERDGIELWLKKLIEANGRLYVENGEIRQAPPSPCP